jgi:beta-glucosidase
MGNHIYANPASHMSDRIDDLFKLLTVQEKYELIASNGYATKAIKRLHIPSLLLADGPNGIRGGDVGTQGPATVFPCGVAMGATFDEELIQQVGVALAREAKNKGRGSHILLGPYLNIQRRPNSGSNVHSFGEDPFLMSRLGVSYVLGVQSQGVAACPKHFVCATQERDRASHNAIVSERALREIYLSPFKAVVAEAKTYCVMTGAHSVNGEAVSSSHKLVWKILKEEWGFDGAVTMPISPTLLAGLFGLLAP